MSHNRAKRNYLVGVALYVLAAVLRYFATPIFARDPSLAIEESASEISAQHDIPTHQVNGRIP